MNMSAAVVAKLVRDVEAHVQSFENREKRKMKRDLDYMISVMQAAKEGKSIQCRHNSEATNERWRDAGPSWDWRDYDYRIKPEPRKPREWVIFRSGSAVEIRHGKCFIDYGFNSDAIHVREVLPDDGA